MTRRRSVHRAPSPVVADVAPYRCEPAPMPPATQPPAPPSPACPPSLAGRPVALARIRAQARRSSFGPLRNDGEQAPVRVLVNVVALDHQPITRLQANDRLAHMVSHALDALRGARTP